MERNPEGVSFSRSSWDRHPTPTHSPMSVYFGYATANPPGDMCCSCFMVEQTQLPFVWWYSSWPLTLGFALPFKRKGLCGAICLCLPECSDACSWPKTHSVWTVGLLLNKLDPRQWSVQVQSSRTWEGTPEEVFWVDRPFRGSPGKLQLFLQLPRLVVGIPGMSGRISLSATCWIIKSEVVTAAKPVLSQSPLQSNCSAFWVFRVEIQSPPYVHSEHSALIPWETQMNHLFQDEPTYLPAREGHLLDNRHTKCIAVLFVPPPLCASDHLKYKAH